MGDTRYSGSEMVVRKLTEMGAEMRVHDPYVDHWYELESQDTYPAPGHSWARFFRNQEDLTNIRVQKDLADGAQGRRCRGPGRAARALPGARARARSSSGPAGRWPSSTASASSATTKIRRYFELGCEVKALGRGHIQRIKEEVRGGKRKVRLVGQG